VLFVFFPNFFSCVIPILHDIWRECRGLERREKTEGSCLITVSILFSSKSCPSENKFIILSKIAEKFIVSNFIRPAIAYDVVIDQFAFKPTGSTTCALCLSTTPCNEAIGI